MQSRKIGKKRMRLRAAEISPSKSSGQCQRSPRRGFVFPSLFPFSGANKSVESNDYKNENHCCSEFKIQLKFVTNVRIFVVTLIL